MKRYPSKRIHCIALKYDAISKTYFPGEKLADLGGLET